MKRAREGDAADAAQPSGDAAEPAPAAAAAEGLVSDSEEEEEAGAGGPRARRGGAKSARECPFLDTVHRAALDFDFEKCCSVTLSPLHCYACLVCGKYFQGRGPATVAYTHALEAGHHVFMNLADGRVYCLPDGYEVLDRSLDDIRHVLNPRFAPEALAQLDANRAWSRALDGAEYLPGVIGLNNLKATDYVSVVLQALMRVKPLRDAMLLRVSPPPGAPGADSPVLQRFGELTRKVWNPRNFKGQVSPHEFLQAVVGASKKRFRIDAQGDPVEFLAWFLHELHRDLGGSKAPGSSVVDKAFQGRLRVTTHTPGAPPTSASVPFYMLGCDLPPPPLFADVMEKNIIPQVPISQVLSKFDGVTEADVPRGGRKTYALEALPPYLVLHMKRFTRNNFYLEKNPTIVTFPVRNLELRDALPLPPGVASKYDLVANICHDGKPGEGAYRAQVHHAADGMWYEISDLSVTEVLPQQVALSECFIQIYARK